MRMLKEGCRDARRGGPLANWRERSTSLFLLEEHKFKLRTCSKSYGF